MPRKKEHVELESGHTRIPDEPTFASMKTTCWHRKVEPTAVLPDRIGMRHHVPREGHKGHPPGAPGFEKIKRQLRNQNQGR